MIGKEKNFQENTEQVLTIPVVISSWWDDLNNLQQQNLANLVFNRLNEQWEPINDFNLDDNDKKLLYVFSNCL
jgi:hypothetical protein